MCGIIGYIGDGDVADIVHRGLQNLEYRGYDSAGIALRDGGLTVAKRTGEVADLVVPNVDGASVAIGHTRWSTHGPPTDANAHPHVDCDGRVAVVHNGIIENHDALRDELSSHAFTSETDTEVVPHLLEAHLEEGRPLREAVTRVTDRVEGSYALCVLCADEERIVATRDGSPLVVGHGDDGAFVASDVPAFLEHTRAVSYLKDGQLATLSPDAVTVFEGGEAVDPAVETVDWEPEAAQRGGYEHYMRKEIHEQPQALRQTVAERLSIDAGTVALDLTFPEGYLESLQEVQLVAAGTSYYAALYGAALLERFADVRTEVVLASEYDFGGGRDPWRTLAIAVTQSGETKDTLDAIAVADGVGAQTLGVTNVMGSSVTRTVDDVVYIRAGPEIGVAATKTFASQVCTLAMLAIHLGRRRGTLSADAARDRLANLESLPGAVQRILDRERAVREVAETYLDPSAYFFIGRQLGLPVALEGALKLKEIAYVHAEGFAAGELKHGPLALVTADTPVIAVMTEGTNAEATWHNVVEAQTRGAPAIGVQSAAGTYGQMDVSFEVPAVGFVEPLVANVYLQLFAYHTAKLLGRPIDKPRNLAKSVTVE